MKRAGVRLFGGILCVALLAGCATIMQGTTQAVGISSNPTGATVTVDNIQNGKTPVVANLKRKDNHIVKIEMAGYQPFEATLTRQTSGWVWGNIVFGGLIGLAVDAISGGMYKLTPEQIQAELKSGNISWVPNNDTLFVNVVLKPNPAWEKVGQLRRRT